MKICHVIYNYKAKLEQYGGIWIGSFDDFTEKEFVEESKLSLVKDMYSFARDNFPNLSKV